VPRAGREPSQPHRRADWSTEKPGRSEYRPRGRGHPARGRRPIRSSGPAGRPDPSGSVGLSGPTPPDLAPSPDPGRAVRDWTEPVSPAISHHPTSGIDSAGGRSGGVPRTRSHTVCSLGGRSPAPMISSGRGSCRTRRAAPGWSDPSVAPRWTSAGDSHLGGRHDRAGQGRLCCALRSDRSERRRESAAPGGVADGRPKSAAPLV
jgi:hypothetical protein